MKTLSHPIADGVAVLGISKSIMGAFWYRLIDKFGEDHIQLVFHDTDYLVLILIADTYKEADIYHTYNLNQISPISLTLMVFQMFLK